MSVFGKPVIICMFSLTSQEYTMWGYLLHKKLRKEINAALFYQLEKELSLEDSIKVSNLFLICTSSLLEENHLQPELETEVSSYIGPYIIPYYLNIP